MHQSRLVVYRVGMTMNESPSEQIAADLALAIHRGSIRPGAQLPSQTKLMASYGVAMGTVSSALAKLSAAGLIRTERGKGTYAHADRFQSSPVRDLLAAASLCRSVAATTFLPSDPKPTIGVGGDEDWDDPHRDPEKVRPPRWIDVSALNGLDRHVTRWMSEAFIQGARRAVGAGLDESDKHLLAAARSILEAGGRRPENQPGIAESGGPTPPAEDVVLRIWPERATPPAANPWSPS